MWSPQAGKLPGSGYVVSCGMTGVHMQGLLCHMYRTSMHGQVQRLYKWRIEQFKSCLPSSARKKQSISAEPAPASPASAHPRNYPPRRPFGVKFCLPAMLFAWESLRECRSCVKAGLADRKMDL